MILMHPFLKQIFQDVMNLTSLFNMGDVNFRLDPHELQEVMVSVGHRLIRFHPLCEPQLENEVESAYHIGLIVFVTTLYIQRGRRRFLKYRLVGKCLIETINRSLDEENGDLMLWLLFLGAISVLQDLDRNFLVDKIQKVMLSVHISTWEAVHKSLLRFPWIRTIHDEPGKEFWNSMKLLSANDGY
jgi:hypothetical protein